MKMGQVIVVETNHKSWFSRMVARVTKSNMVHAILVLDDKTGIEANFPRVQRIDLAKRLAKYRSLDRAYVVLDLPELTLGKRFMIGKKADSYVGRFYDVGQFLLFFLTREFWNDGEGTLVCSRLITASYFSGIGEDLFPPEIVLQNFGRGYPRLGNILSGYVIPSDLLKSRLKMVELQPSSRVKSLTDFHSK